MTHHFIGLIKDDDWRKLVFSISIRKERVKVWRKLKTGAMFFLLYMVWLTLWELQLVNIFRSLQVVGQVSNVIDFVKCKHLFYIINMI